MLTATLDAHRQARHERVRIGGELLQRYRGTHGKQGLQRGLQRAPEVQQVRSACRSLLPALAGARVGLLVVGERGAGAELVHLRVGFRLPLRLLLPLQLAVPALGLRGGRARARAAGSARTDGGVSVGTARELPARESPARQPRTPIVRELRARGSHARESPARGLRARPGRVAVRGRLRSR